MWTTSTDSVSGENIDTIPLDLLAAFSHVGTNRRNSADGKGQFRAIGEMRPDHLCKPEGLHFIDMNADGLSDLACVNSDGSLSISINNGDGSGSTPPTFGPVLDIKKSEGKQNRVR